MGNATNLVRAIAISQMFRFSNEDFPAFDGELQPSSG
ncbi:hypothetical protein DSM3645_23236 [Blastopirellula marina DSM 3645]|uniref:Uncharacterized protein n=1 Tax=Blastopirellula marina DSM 3645 TaxID=314230 RepID=A3ZQ84_9BACT|nr:hypothetical protein DSM3645_23236 [Blastopirellula marina DSM 3645]